MSTIRFKRGLSVNLGALTLQSGEPAFATDTGELFIGNGTTNVLVTGGSGGSGDGGAVSSVAGRTGAIILNKDDVGLHNVDNESKITMFTNSTFTGTPTAPTPVTSDNSNQIATTAFVKSQGYAVANGTIDGGSF